MPGVVPAFATVRPRVTRGAAGDSRPADEVVAELADEMPCGVVTLRGDVGSGKSTALAHLRAALANRDQLVFLDEPSAREMETYEGRIIVRTMRLGAAAQSIERASHVVMNIAPWRIEELAEYLLAVHPQACESVVTRLGYAARIAWLPQLATIVLDRFAARSDAESVLAELGAHVRELFANDDQWSAALRHCFAEYVLGETAARQSTDYRELASFSANVCSLLRHRMVQQALAVDALAASLHAGTTGDLEHRLPDDLIEAASARCAADRTSRLTLQRALRAPSQGHAQANAASFMLAADATWRPWPRTRKPWQLSGGQFGAARWDGVDLTKAKLERADLTGARLAGANLAEAALGGARLDSAQLDDATLISVTAERASFCDAQLVRAKLSGAALRAADFTGANLADAALMNAELCSANLTSALLAGADLTNADLTYAILADAALERAVLRRAQLTSVDLRTAEWTGANLENAILDRAQLEDLRWPNAKLAEARLEGAHLTGAWMPRADLRGASLCLAGLAEVDWEDADLRDANLRGATFHMGSSRSGLVGSPIACEGSKTGFYTDDFEDMHFKRPEEIRKANLCGADLRGARIDNVDFYLVDLRDAKLDADQLAHVQRCGAILAWAAA